MGRNDAPSPADDSTPARIGWHLRHAGPRRRPGPAGRRRASGRARPDAAGMLQSAMDLLSPAEAAKQLPWLVGELTKIALGQSDLEYGPKDARFKDPTWTANPAYRGLGLSYRLFEEWAGRMADAVGHPRGRGRRGPATWPTS